MTKIKLFDLKLDRTRKVRMDLGALEDAEELSGYNFLARGFDNLSAKALKALVWASCKHEDPQLTPEKVRELVHGGNFAVVVEVMARAYQQAMPEPEPRDEGGEEAPRPPKLAAS
jgi:hypothetical protein